MNNKDFFNENINQNSAIKLLKKLKYEYITTEKANELRGNLYNVLLKPILRESLNRLNSYNYKGREYKFSEKNINAAISDIDEILTDGLFKTNEKIYHSLIFGRSYTENLEDGTTRSFSIQFIDWENINNNSFYVANDLIVQNEDKKIVTNPDLILFINGIPFGIIEFKAAFNSINKGIDQITSYQSKDYILQLFKFIQIAMVTNGIETKYATCGTYGSSWSVWQEKDTDWLNNKLEELCLDRLPTNQDSNIISLFAPGRVIELIKNFIIYFNSVKIICRYHHYFAVKDIIKTINKSDEKGNRQSGIIYQAPGSGKSLTMIILTKYILSELKAFHPKVIVVTDTLDLDYQISARFNDAGLNAVRATTVSHLRELIYTNEISVVTTVIQKFNADLALENSESRDIFILIDDSNLSRANKLNTNIKKIFPNACYLRFTSNPFLKNNKALDKYSENLIHSYTIEDAVNDKSTIPVLYEERMEQSFCMRLDTITRNLNDNYKSQFLKKWNLFKKNHQVSETYNLIEPDIFTKQRNLFKYVTSSPQRLNAITFDINAHFVNNFKSKNLPYTAILAADCQTDAIKYLRAFEALGDLNVGLLITPTFSMRNHNKAYRRSDPEGEFCDEIIEKYGNYNYYNEIIINKLNNGELDLLIGVNRILTGFDIPQATILYIDKNIKEYALFQAISIINRPYSGKEYGYIVDYRGVIKNLKITTEMYSKFALCDISLIIDHLKRDYRKLTDFFSLIEDKRDHEKYELYLSDKKLREEFYNILYKFSINFSIALESETISNYFDKLDKKELEEYKSCFMFYQKLRESVKHRYSDVIYTKEYEAKIQKIFDNYISTEDIFKITNLSDILNKEAFDKEICRIDNSRSKADTIRSRLSSSILEKCDENPAYYQKFSDRIEKTFEEYNNRQLTDLDYLNKIEDILKNYREKKDCIYYPDSIKTNEDAKAFYGVLTDVIEESKFSYELKEEDIGRVALKIDNIIKENIKVDWHDNIDVQNKIAQEIDDILYDYTRDNRVEIPFEDIDEIIKKAINVGLNRY